MNTLGKLRQLAVLLGVVCCFGCTGERAYWHQDGSLSTQLYEDIVAFRKVMYDAAQKLQVPSEPALAQYGRLLSSLDRVDPSIKFRLAFHTCDVFLVNTHATGQSYSCETNESLQTEGAAWVVGDPRNPAKALLLLSTVAPKHTTILAIDRWLQITPVYDPKLTANKFRGDAEPPVDYVGRVEVVDHDKLILHETWVESISQVAFGPRTFLLQLDSYKLSGVANTNAMRIHSGKKQVE